MGALNFCVDYKADSGRYDGRMPYRKCGNSGIRLPELSLGFWWNFGGINPLEESREKILYAFDHGITCFDLANNYGPPFGTAEQTFGRVYKDNLRPYRNEMIVTTKAGYNMWEGPYGCGSSRKMLMASIDDSLRRMNLDYVDIFYSHRYDPETPIDETMQALVDIVRQRAVPQLPHYLKAIGTVAPPGIRVFLGRGFEEAQVKVRPGCHAYTVAQHVHHTAAVVVRLKLVDKPLHEPLTRARTVQTLNLGPFLGLGLLHELHEGVRLQSRFAVVVRLRLCIASESAPAPKTQDRLYIVLEVFLRCLRHLHPEVLDRNL